MIRRFIGRVFITLGVLFALLIAGGTGAAWWAARSGGTVTPLPARMVLRLDLREPLKETVDQGGAGAEIFGLGMGTTVAKVVLTLDRASRDPHVLGVLVRLGDGGQGFAVAQELRDAISRFRGSGRFAYAFADSFGEVGGGTEGYYLASAFDRIMLQPAGALGLTGLHAETPFARDLLARIGVAPEVIKREAYKSALDSFTENGPTPASTEMLNALLDSLYGQVVDGIARSRGLDVVTVRSLIDGGPYTAREALANKLVDTNGYYDEAVEGARISGHGADLVSLQRYAATAGDGVGEATTVAMIRAVGPIQRGSGSLLARDTIYADDTADAIRDAAADRDVKAILLRIDSPGGSAVASDTIGREIREARAKGKPVIVSMGNTAASGGYWIAMDADRIIAEPGTITGSIGVILGKPVLAELWKKLDVTWSSTNRGAHAGMWSLNDAFDPSAKARAEALVDALYDDFKNGVARGRNLSPEAVEEVAQGRVWTGAMALDRKLVDALGGYTEALAATRLAAGLTKDEPLRLVDFPREQNPIRQLLRAVAGQMGANIGAMIGLDAMAPAGLEARAPDVTVR